MRYRGVLLFATAVLVIALIAGLSGAAGPKQYQFTGVVTVLDDKAKTIGVDKGGEVWEFSTQGLKGVKAKAGDKVTVYYQMVAKKIEK